MTERIHENPAALDEPAPVPIPAPYTELAAALIRAVDFIMASVPEFGAPVVAANVVERKRRVPPEFVTRAVNTLTLSAELQSIEILDPAQTIDDKQFIEAFEPLAVHLFTAFKGLRRVIVARKTRLTASAQRIYAFSRALAREREAAPIADHVTEMKRTIRPRHRRRTADLIGSTTGSRQ